MSTRARRVVDVRTGALVVASMVVLFLLSLCPRAINLGGSLTNDEPNWLGRSVGFGRALVQGAPAETYQSGHPGVMTMWTALLGIGIDRVGWVAEDGEQAESGRYLAPENRRSARAAFAAVTSVAVVLVALLAWRLFGAGPGLLAGVLVGLEPFLLANSVLVHVDTHVAIWMSICMLAALVYFWADGAWGYLALSGVAAGLAFLSKAPSAFLPLFIPIVALTALARSRGLADRRAWLGLIRAGLIWGMLALVTALVLWPAFRVDPLGTLLRMAEYTESIGGAEHDNVFFGRAVGDPGPLYYPVALAFRLTPVTMLGLALLIVALFRRGFFGWGPRLALLAAYSGLFVLMMTLAPKKFDRYLLPIFPTLEVLAAVGFWLAVRRLPRSTGRWALPAALLVVGVAQAAPAAQVSPYYLAYYNPLLGGGAAAERAIIVGRGEGLDVVVDYLNAQPDADRLVVAGGPPGLLRTQLVGARRVREFGVAASYADYVVHYVNRVQRGYVDALRPLSRGRPSELDVTINGIEYARLFRVTPKPERNAVGTEFGGAARLERAVLLAHAEADEIRGGDRLEVRLWWAVLGSAGEGLASMVELVDGSGETVGRAEGSIVSMEGPATRRGGEASGVSHWLKLPGRAGRYEVVMGLRRPDGVLLSVTSWPPTLVEQARRPPGRVLIETVEAQ